VNGELEDCKLQTWLIKIL